MQTKHIRALLEDIQKLGNYLNRYMTRSLGAKEALGIPGTRILNRILSHVTRVQNDIEAIEAMIKGARPLIASDEEIKQLREQIAALELNNANLRQTSDRHALNAQTYQAKAKKTVEELNTLTIKYNRLYCAVYCDKETA